MKVVRLFKKLNFRKSKVVTIEDMFIPVRTLSISEENAIRINIPFNLPSKIDVLSAKDMDTIKKADKNYNPLTYPAVKTYDKTSQEWQTYEEEVAKYSPILDGVKYIDFDYKDEEGNTFLALLMQNGLPQMDIKKIDWLTVCKFFEEAGITDNVINDIIVAVKSLKGENVYEKLSKISSLVNMDYITLIGHLENITDLYDTVKTQEITIDELYEKLEQAETSKLSILKTGVDLEDSNKELSNETV